MCVRFWEDHANDPFDQVTGAAAPMMAPNVDTDVIMPKMFLRAWTVAASARRLQPAALQRRQVQSGIHPEPGRLSRRLLSCGRPEFRLRVEPRARRLGLQQLGIRALIGTSFAGIFNDNCANNGLLTISLDPVVVTELAQVVADSSRNGVTIDLAAQTIRFDRGRRSITFDIELARKGGLPDGPRFHRVHACLRRRYPRLRGAVSRGEPLDRLNGTISARLDPPCRER